MNKRLLFLLMLFFSFQISAQEMGKSLHFEGIASFGSGSSYTDSEVDSPDNLFYEVALTGGYFLTPSIYLGITASYQKIGQSSDADQPHGNRSGIRQEFFSPTLGIRFLPLYLKFEYAAGGDYQMEENTVLGKELSYSDIDGYRVSAFWVGSGNPLFGIYYEDISFKKEIQDSTSFTLSDELKVSHYGVSVAWVF